MNHAYIKSTEAKPKLVESLIFDGGIIDDLSLSGAGGFRFKVIGF